MEVVPGENAPSSAKDVPPEPLPHPAEQLMSKRPLASSSAIAALPLDSVGGDESYRPARTSRPLPTAEVDACVPMTSKLPLPATVRVPSVAESMMTCCAEGNTTVAFKLAAVLC